MRKLCLFFEGVSQCGIVVFLAMLFEVVVWYGIENDITVDVVGGGMLLGGCLEYIWHEAIEYMLDHDEEDEF